jgi:hypothetical protein
MQRTAIVFFGAHKIYNVSTVIGIAMRFADGNCQCNFLLFLTCPPGIVGEIQSFLINLYDENYFGSNLFIFHEEII